MVKLGIHILILGLLFCLPFPVMAQERVNVITRRIEQEYPAKSGDRLILNAERGIIRIRGWQEPKIKVIIRIVAKNQDIDQAREDAGYMQYTLNQRRGEVFVKNYLVLPRNKAIAELTSILRVEYEIWVPDNIDLDLQNRFGTVMIHDLTTHLSAMLEYSDLGLQGFKGDADVSINIGDLNCQRSSLRAGITTRYAAVNMVDVTGEIKLNMASGSLQVRTHPNMSLDLTSDKTAVMLSNRNCENIGLQLKADYTIVRMEKACFFPDLERLLYNEDMNGQEGLKIDYKPAGQSDYLLLLNMRYGSLNLD